MAVMKPMPCTIGNVIEGATFDCGAKQMFAEKACGESTFNVLPLCGQNNCERHTYGPISAAPNMILLIPMGLMKYVI
jgi:hypothetical protein